MSPATLQDAPSVKSFFTVVETEMLALFEHLSFEFLKEFVLPEEPDSRDLSPHGLH